ncbi:hypothetical protein C8A05DRAFT_40352 [Staphylotrichum tortipilum]|uniref:Uncharacterized protein n=1 Tax=Staphylotrichum tortipilum TaxID=2831512 RepID=A0AAN6MTL3_9PEZI|nr:hypothetical protein C8A05DRAFT_40352 [Staphylotrichum longicolle]
MTRDIPHEASGCPSPARPASEGNSSIQVNINSSSHCGRGGSVGRRSRSPSTRVSEPSLARQATTHSLPPSFLSPRPSPHPEDYLRDLISVPGSSINPVHGGQHGVKRPRDDEATDEPLAKRDKLGEELERMYASRLALASATAASLSPAVSASSLANTAHAPPATGIHLTVPGDRPLASTTRDVLPIRHPLQQPPRLGNGSAMSRGGIPEALEPPLGHETEHSADGRGTHGETPSP